MDQGKDEGTVRRKLDQKTQDALRKLDAVENVTETRIQYSEGFRKTALERDRRGDSLDWQRCVGQVLRGRVPVR